MAIIFVTATLDMLLETLEFVQSILNEVTDELEALDDDSISTLSFNALESINLTNNTLNIFFQVLLLNYYKKI